MEEESKTKFSMNVEFSFSFKKRVKSALKWLRDTKKQAIIFTCQKREQEIFYRHMEGR